MKNRIVTQAEWAAAQRLLPDNTTREISPQDVRDALRPLYELVIDINEPYIRSLIAQSSLFQGTVRQTAAQGSVAVAALPIPAIANKGEYWTVAEAFTVTTGPLSGQVLEPGDWIQSLGDTTHGLGGWTIISGGLLTESKAIGMFGLGDHDPTVAYEHGSLVVHDGIIWAAKGDLTAHAWNATEWEPRFWADSLSISTAAIRQNLPPSLGAIHIATDTGDISIWDGFAWVVETTIPLDAIHSPPSPADGDVIHWDPDGISTGVGTWVAVDPATIVPTFQFTEIVQTVTDPTTQLTWAQHAAAPWASLTIGVPTIIKHVDTGNVIPAAAYRTIQGQTAQVGDWVIPVDNNNDGVADGFEIQHWGVPPPSVPGVTISTVAGATPL